MSFGRIQEHGGSKSSVRSFSNHVRHMPYHNRMDGSYLQPYVVVDKPRKCKNVQRLPYQSIGLLRFQLYRMPHKDADGLGSQKRERLRL